ncbi:MAG TPA: hypothetical protein VFY89_09120 [Ktedonobacterales bacterium]
MAATQAKLAPATDWEIVVESCYMAAHNFIVAGAEWTGVPHPQSHKHAANVSLLQRAAAPQDVREAWDQLEVLRAGNIYGGHTDPAAADEARQYLATIQRWASAKKP